MGLALDRSVVISLFIEAIIYGLCLTLSVVTVIVFLRTRAEGGIARKRLLWVLLLMVVTATAHVVLSFIRVFTAYCLIPNTPGGAVNYFADIRAPAFIARNAFLLLQTIWGDSVNIWRCFMVYDRKKAAIAIPMVVMLAGITLGSYALGISSHASQGTTIYATPGRWIKAYDVLMMSTSVYCTAAIFWKIYRTGSHKITGSSLFPVLVAIVETNTVYTACLLIYLITYWANSNTQFILIGIVPISCSVVILPPHSPSEIPTKQAQCL